MRLIALETCKIALRPTLRNLGQKFFKFLQIFKVAKCKCKFFLKLFQTIQNQYESVLKVVWQCVFLFFKLQILVWLCVFFFKARVNGGSNHHSWRVQQRSGARLSWDCSQPKLFLNSGGRSAAARRPTLCFWKSFIYKWLSVNFFRQRPYHVEHTGSRPITEVKQRRARLVLGWVTAWEHRVQLASSFLFFFFKRQEIDKELYIFGECYYNFRVWVSLGLIIFFVLMITTGKSLLCFDLLMKTTGKSVLCFYIWN